MYIKKHLNKYTKAEYNDMMFGLFDSLRKLGMEGIEAVKEAKQKDKAKQKKRKKK